MPTRRRPTHSAAALPASRLPLGTPNFHTSPQDTDSSSHSQLQQRTSSSSLRKQKSSDSVLHSDDMTSKQEAELPSAKSIAEAKLERQQKRIDETDVLPQRKRGVRNKAKQWKPFDFTADTARPADSHDGGVPVSEVRVNTFRALNRDTSSVRSESLISQRTNETGPSDRDMDRHDSIGLDPSFQVVRRRGQKKDVGELNAYEDSPEKRQTTVEATIDTREIYDVFGNALPNPRFIEENAGTQNGEVQFVQHPNGDVSAHQWSYDRFMWENIGQFSNIRKKIEGQLASERLKGETAYQTLQQNTLAYFKTIAKQREATVMGLPFGAKDVQAAMPQQRPDQLTSAPTGLKDKVAIPLKLPQPRSEYQDTAAPSLRPPVRSFMPQNILQRQTSYMPNHGMQTPGYDDPFYCDNNYHRIYGSSQYPGQFQNSYSPYQGTNNNPYFGIAQRPQGMNFDFQFPPVTQSSQTTYLPAGMSNRKGSVVPQASSSQAQQYSQIPPATFQSSTTLSPAMYGRPPTEIAAPQSKPVVPFGSRGSMSDQLWKISETAKERNLSQTNIARTVMHDPLLKEDSRVTAETPTESQKQSVLPSGPTFSQNVAGHKLQPPTSFDPTSANFFPTVLALPQSASPDPVESSSLAAPAPENNLQDSSPDTYESAKSYDYSTPSIARAAQLQPTPQNFNGPFFPADEKSHVSAARPGLSSTIKKSYDEELHDWWTSGNKFARQQEFFDSIMAAHKSTDSSSSINSPPAHLTPISPPSSASKKKETKTPPFNPMTTRLLIPMLENLASYVQGPVEKRRDYFCPWSDPPEWAVDHSESGNNSFYDYNWGRPPARVGRDPRYQNRSWNAESTPQHSRYDQASNRGSISGIGMGAAVGGGIDRRFNFTGRY